MPRQKTSQPKQFYVLLAIFAVVGVIVLANARAAVNLIGVDLNEPANLLAQDASAANGSYLKFARQKPLSHECEPYQPLKPSDNGITHKPQNQSELNQAIKAAKPGDVIELSTSGTYDRIGYDSRDNSIAGGTADNPVIIQAGQGQSPVINPFRESTQNLSAISIFRVNNVVVRGLNVSGGTSGVSIQASENILVEHMDIQGALFDGIHARSDFLFDKFHTGEEIIPSRNITIRCNKLHDLGPGDVNNSGRGVYLGWRNFPHEERGTNDPLDTTSNVLVEKNEVYNNPAAAFSMQEGVHSVVIRDNYVHDLAFQFGKALPAIVEVSQFAVNYPSADILIERNVFMNATTNDPDQASVKALLFGHGGVTVRNNIFANVGDLIFRAMGNFRGTQGLFVDYGWGNPNAVDVTFQNNTIWGCTGGCVFLDNSPARLISQNNISSDRFNGDGLAVTADDFIGPLTGEADAGRGPGSGFTLKSTSAAVDSAQTLESFSDDLFQTVRPRGSAWDAGAIESR